MWDLPRPGLKPVSPALAGRFLTTALPGKSLFLPLRVTFHEANFHIQMWSLFQMELCPSYGLNVLKTEEMTRVSCSMLASVEFYWFSKKKEKKRKSNILRIYQVCRAVNRFAPPSMLIALQCQRSSLETHKLAVLGIRDTQTIRESQHSRGFRCLDRKSVV